MKTNHITTYLRLLPVLTRFALAGATLELANHSPVCGQNPDLPYVSGSTGADGALTIPNPGSKRTDFAMAYDSQRQRIVIFGGYSDPEHLGTVDETLEPENAGQ
jgi:hypothetical protein